MARLWRDGVLILSDPQIISASLINLCDTLICSVSPGAEPKPSARDVVTSFARRQRNWADTAVCHASRPVALRQLLTKCRESPLQLACPAAPVALVASCWDPPLSAIRSCSSVSGGSEV